MKKIFLIILSTFIFFGFDASFIIFKSGKWDSHQINNVITQAKFQGVPGNRIEYISSFFIGTPYEDNTLVGDANTEERLVVNFSGVDCLTFLEYVEAMRLAESGSRLADALKDVRYCKHEVTYETRKHFFTDWAYSEEPSVKDITTTLPGSIGVAKILNRKNNSDNWLNNIPHRKRVVTYLPAEKITKVVIELLKNGDYIGSYADMKGLDVTHTGIFIRNKDGIFLRNASSKKNNMRVVDYPFEDYIKNIKGIVVLRPM